MKLIKTNDGYNLVSEQPQGKLLEATCSEKELKSLTKNHITLGKLSKQNCDEIFGVVDVEKLARELHPCPEDAIAPIRGINGAFRNGFVAGFNKAMELNKDKVFTIPEVIKLCTDYYRIGLVEVSMPHEKRAVLPKEIIEDLKLLRPTEIEVEIVMENTNLKYDGGSSVDFTTRPKLDSEENLILKKK